MSDFEEIGEWIAKAEEDYAGAVDLQRRRKNPLPNLVCFHAQQCAEKYLKAYLISQRIPFYHEKSQIDDRARRRRTDDLAQRRDREKHRQSVGLLR